MDIIERIDFINAYWRAMVSSTNKHTASEGAMTTLKTMTYAVMHFSVAVTVAYAVSGNWKTALAIGTLEPLVQTIAYMAHERAWEKYTPRVQHWMHTHHLPLMR
jgi:uncharacterized membrane protein